MNIRNQYDYQVAISFAGEDRAKVEELVNLLKQNGITVFYDYDEQAALWGKDLYQYLNNIYANKSQFCIPVVSKNYPQKLWTRHEMRSAQSRAFKEEREYILPLRLDDTEIDGIPDTIGYVDLRKVSLDRIVKMVKEKLHITNESNNTQSNDIIQSYNIPMPKFKKQFSDLDKDKFQRETFQVIKDYFNQGLKLIENQDNSYAGDYHEIDARKFIGKIYVNGTSKCRCTIWIGGIVGMSGICYLAGEERGGSGNSMNDYISISDDGEKLFWQPSGMRMFQVQRNQKLNPQEAAKYFWDEFIEPLNH